MRFNSFFQPFEPSESMPTVSFISKFNNELLNKAADYFGVTTDFLLDRTDNSTTSNPIEQPQVRKIIDTLGRAKDVLDEMDYMKLQIK